jgi:YHS domain-containing protein
MLLRVVLELLLILFLARAVWRVIGGVIEGVAYPERAKPQRSTLMARDPVCGTFVLPERAVVLTEGRGRVFFCSTKCRDAYRVRGETDDAQPHGSSAGRDPRGPRVA